MSHPGGGPAHASGAHSAVDRGALADPGHSPDVDLPLGELLGKVTRDLSTLVRQELALAQAELKIEAAKAGKAAGAMGAAGLAGYFVLLFLSFALYAGLSNVMNAGWAALIVAAIWAIAAGVLFVTGRATLQKLNPRPDRTVETLSTVPDALAGRRGGTS